MEKTTVFGQIVMGPPGSGKTTYTKAIAGHLREMGRNVLLVNLDPGNDERLPYEAAVDVADLITVEDTMNKLKLGPNGGLLYCMEYLETNYDWLRNCICNAVEKQKDPYVIIDSPGQVELYVHHNSLRNIIRRLTGRDEKLDIRLCAVNLVDSHYCNEPGKYISALLTALATMVHTELPHVNVLSKIDLIEKYGKISFGVDYFCDVLDLDFLVERIADDAFTRKYKNLTKSIANVVQDYSLVSFIPLDINNSKTIAPLVQTIDKANGFVLTNSEEGPLYFANPSNCDYSKYVNVEDE